MTKDEKTTELIRHRDIILATIDYIVAGIDWKEVPDHRDVINEHYAQQRRQTEKYYCDRRLDRLQQKLENLIKWPQGRGELNFDTYVNDKTGYKIDIFEKIRKRTDAILRQGQINSGKDLNDIAILLNTYDKHPEYRTKIEKLKALLITFSERTRNKNSSRNRNNSL